MIDPITLEALHGFAPSPSRTDSDEGEIDASDGLKALP
jgi:hypothetical protein